MYRLPLGEQVPLRKVQQIRKQVMIEVKSKDVAPTRSHDEDVRNFLNAQQTKYDDYYDRVGILSKRTIEYVT